MCTRMWLLLALIVLAGCAQPELPAVGDPRDSNPPSPYDELRQRARSLTDDTAAVFGTVIGEDGTPIPGAGVLVRVVSAEPVQLSEALHSTGAEGKFSRGLPPATYEISVEAEGFQRDTKRVELRPREVRMVNFVLRRTNR